MNTQTDKVSLVSRIHGAAKRGLALLVAVLLIIPTQLPGLSFTARAAEDPPLVSDANPDDNGGGLATAYKMDARWYDIPNQTYVLGGYDIQGIEDAANIGSENPYVTDRQHAVYTTYATKNGMIGTGYQTYVQPFDASKPNTRNGSAEKYVDNHRNGEVVDIPDLGVQVKVNVHPSNDEKWIVAEYQVHNTRDAVNPIQLGTSADIKIGGDPTTDNRDPAKDPADGSRLEINSRGFHMVNTSTKQSFDLMYNFPGLDLDRPDSAWIGARNDMGNNRYAESRDASGEAVINDGSAASVDSALGFSWHADLAPHQTVTKRIAFGTKGASYYVNADQGQDSNDGSYYAPFKTIQAALTAIGSRPSPEKAAYIYLQSDVNLDQTITLPENRNVSILSTDYDITGKPALDFHKIIRAPGFTGPMFIDHGDLRFSNMGLDGNQTAVPSAGPIIQADKGSVTIASDTVLEHNKVTASGVGSAIDATGSADLIIVTGTDPAPQGMLPAKISGNVSKDRGAIHFNSTGKFSLSGAIPIEDNTDESGKKANIYLPDGKYITVKDSLGNAKIGITTEKTPAVSPGETPNGDDQQIIVAAPFKGSSQDASPSPFAGNFFADKETDPAQTAIGLHTSAGTSGEVLLPGSTSEKTDRGKTVIMKNVGYALTFKTATKAGDAAMPNPPQIPALGYMGGTQVDTPPAPPVTGYKLDSTAISQGTGTALTAADPGKADGGKITGTMPSQNVEVTYTYRKEVSRISFDTNGGTPETIAPLNGDPGTPVPPKPADPTREGYQFLGWSEENKGEASPIFTWPSTFPDPIREITLYATWKQIKYDYTVEHTNEDGTLVFKSDTQTEAKPFGEGLTEQKISVPGYQFDAEKSQAATTGGTGTFKGDGTYTGTMPADQFTVHYVYTLKPEQTYRLTVNYQTAEGVMIHDSDLLNVKPGEKPSGGPIAPLVLPGYQCTGASFGATGNEDPAQGIAGVKTPPQAPDWKWDEAMPNQALELTYTYEKVSDQWMDINFGAEKGKLASGSETLNVPKIGEDGKTLTWGELKKAYTLPAYAPWSDKYIKDAAHNDGWYMRTGTGEPYTYTLMEDNTPLNVDSNVTVAYIQKFIPDPAKTNSITRTYKNEDGSLTFGTDHAGDEPIEASLSLPAAKVPGYNVMPGSSAATPSEYKFNPDGTAESVGSFVQNGENKGDFTLEKMPGEPLTVNYVYQVDPNQKCRLTITRVSDNGTDLGGSVSQDVAAQEKITIPKASPAPGYVANVTPYVITAGDKASEGSYLTKLEELTADGDNWTFNMPNQAVTIVLKYHGDANAKHKVTEKYIDSGSADTALREGNLPPTVQKDIAPDTAINGSYAEPYGYKKEGQGQIQYLPAPPADLSAVKPQDIAFNPGDENEWSGHMPGADVEITYNNSRNPEKWSTITYKAGKHGSLSKAGMSPDLKDGADAGTYVADVLVTDGSAKGNAAAYTLDGSNSIVGRKLAPKAVPGDETLYGFEGWFVDANGDTIRQTDGSEPLIDANHQFAKTDGPITLTASFTEDAQSWFDIHFGVEKGSWEAGASQKLHVHAGQKWGDIENSLPKSSPWDGYVEDGWYVGGQKVTPETVLTKEAIYVHKYQPDPAKTFGCKVEYTNEDGSVVFKTTAVNQKKLNDEVTATLETIPGYHWDKTASEQALPSYAFDPGVGPVPVGTFQDSGAFAGHMPKGPLTVIYKYALNTPGDPSNPPLEVKLTVNYVAKDQGGTEKPIHEAYGPITLHPGDSIQGPVGGPVAPEDVDGYKLIKPSEAQGNPFRFDKGKFQEVSGNPVQPVQGGPDSNNGWKWTGGIMPNQDVELTYLYEVDKNKGYDLTVRYEDEDAPGGPGIISEKKIDSYQAGAHIEGTCDQPYGYERVGYETRLTPAWDLPADITYNEGDGSWSGTMPPRDMTFVYKNRRLTNKWGTITYKAGTQGLGTINGDNTLVTPGGSGEFTAAVLLNDNSQEGKDQSYTLGKLKELKLVPNTPANEGKYYDFKGWFVDDGSGGGVAGDGKLNGSEKLLADTDTFSGNTVLTADFGEKDGAWIDIHFDGDHAAITEASKKTLHIQADKLWKDVAPADPHLPTLVPTEGDYTHDVNYIKVGWFKGNIPMAPDMQLADGQTYTLVYGKDPKIFGTAVTAPDVSGGLDSRGKGKLTVYNTSEGDYNYILTDMDGKVEAVLPKRSRTQRLVFEGLDLGAYYQVYEADKTLPIKRGDQIQGKGETGKTISNPAKAATPVLDGNYEVRYDDGDENEVRTVLRIRPFDPDSEYAVLDENGNPVMAPGAQAGGWFTPSKVAEYLVIPGLGYEAKYTVVARPRGQEDSAQSRAGTGSKIITDPVGEPVLKSYIIKNTGGEVDQAGTVLVGADSYRGVHKGDQVILSADLKNDQGMDLQGWTTTIGPLDVSLEAHAYEEDGMAKLTFSMPQGNMVVTPVYKHNYKATPSNALVKDEVRGANRGKIALDPQAARTMEPVVTQPKDQELMDKNGAQVDYHVIYHMGRVSQKEAEAVQADGDYSQHPEAFHGAWSLDVSMERYVDGRKVNIATATNAIYSGNSLKAHKASGSNAMYGGVPVATPSGASQGAGAQDAAPPEENGLLPDEDGGEYGIIYPDAFTTYVQMGRDDVDMLDYQLFEVTEDGNGNVTNVRYVPWDNMDWGAGGDGTGSFDWLNGPQDVPGGAFDLADPANTGGLFAFQAQVGKKYVMVYSRAYRLHFTKEAPFLSNPPAIPTAEYDFKVRRMGKPSEYPEYMNIPTPTPDAETYLLNPATGGEYWYEDWSRSENGMKKFNPDDPVRSAAHLYTHYRNNEPQVEQERELLAKAIQDAWNLSGDPFLKNKDRDELRGHISQAREVLDKEEPRSKEGELRAARELLREQMKLYQDLVKKAHEEYENIHSSSGGGGSGGGGGGGRGVVKDPFNSTPVNEYTVGTNGDWKSWGAIPGKEDKLSFVLNGGLPLRSMWAKLKFPYDEKLNGWYHFNSSATLDTGWFVDEKGNWYYGNETQEGGLGKMATGWHQDSLDGRWYFLDPASGGMATGWRLVNGKWYYLETVGGGSYSYDEGKKKWNYTGGSGHPLGSMYQNETTPDGYKVDENGAWIQ